MEERDNINVSSSVKLKPFEKRLSELYYKHKNVNIRLIVEDSTKYFNTQEIQDAVKDISTKIVRSLNSKIYLVTLKGDTIFYKFSSPREHSDIIYELKKNLFIHNQNDKEVTSLNKAIGKDLENTLMIFVTSGFITENDYKETFEKLKTSNESVSYLVLNLIENNHLYSSLFGYENVFYLDSRSYNIKDILTNPDLIVPNIYPKVKTDYSTRSVKIKIEIDPLLKRQEYTLQFKSTKNIEKDISVEENEIIEVNDLKPGSQVIIRLISKYFDDIIVEHKLYLLSELFYSPYYKHDEFYGDDIFFLQKYNELMMNIKEHENARKVKNFNIVLIGEMGVGKTRLVNTLHSAFMEKEELVAIDHHSSSSTTKQFRSYKLNETNIKIMDIYGYKLQYQSDNKDNSFIQQDFDKNMIRSLLSGKLKEGYSEMNNGRIDDSDIINNSNLGELDKMSLAIHGVFIVFNYDNLYTEISINALREILRIFSELPKDSRITPIILITKVQNAKDSDGIPLNNKLQENPLLLYEMKEIRDIIKQVSNITGYSGESMVFPILSKGDEHHSLTLKHYYTTVYPLLHLLNTCSNLRLTDLCEVYNVDKLEVQKSELDKIGELQKLYNDKEKYDERIKSLEEEISKLKIEIEKLEDEKNFKKLMN